MTDSKLANDKLVVAKFVMGIVDCHMATRLRDISDHLLKTFGHLVPTSTHGLGMQAEAANPAAVEIAKALRTVAADLVPPTVALDDARAAANALGEEAARAALIIDHLRAALEDAAAVFDIYANIHNRKQPPDHGKALANEQHAATCRAAIAWKP